MRQKGKFFKSLKAHLLLVVSLTGLIPLLFFAKIIVITQGNIMRHDKMESLLDHANMTANMLFTSGYFSDGQLEEANAQLYQLAQLYEGRLLIVDSNLLVLEDTYGLEKGSTFLSKRVVQCLRGKEITFIDPKKRWMEVVVPIQNKRQVFGAIVVYSSLQNIASISARLSQKATMLGITIFILVVLFACYDAMKLTRPFQKVVDSLHDFTQGNMDYTITIEGFSEMETLLEAFQQMLLRMQKLEDSRQEFVSNVSHELKTPITSMKVLADSLLMQEEASVELYREFLVDIAEEIERENKIIDDLLAIVKLDKKAGELQIASVSINQLLEIILKRLRPIAAKKNIEVVYESFRPVVAEVDEVKLTLAISNLIENAIKYNQENGWVRVSLNADHRFFYIKVADSGIGIAKEEQESIFERFYRVDKARARESGGTGLGLSIARNAVLLHRGAIKVYSNEGEGTTFTVRIPLNYIVSS